MVDEKTEVEEDLLARLHNEKLQNSQLRRANSRLQSTNRHLSRDLSKLRKEIASERKPELRKGQKRGRFGRNG